MLHGAETLESDKCCIYRVPNLVRKLNEDAYTPDVVSIGPFHHNTHPRFHKMENFKLSYCKEFLERTQTSSDSWISYIKQEVEPHFHSFYSDTLPFSPEKLVNIIFVDSAFVFELFYRNYSRNDSRNHVIFPKPWLEFAIRSDLLLLENQLPFFFLEALFKKFFNFGSNHNIPFIKLTFAYFSRYNRSDLSYDNISIKHFTDLLRAFHLKHPPLTRPERFYNRVVKYLPNATELSEAGVRIKVNRRSKCLLDLNFSRGVLEIPQLLVDDETELLFRNMVALEQCHYPSECYIMDYVNFFDFLVNSSRDVDLLVRKGVLQNFQGDTDSVAKMFNGLCKNNTITNVSRCYFDGAECLTAFCENPCNKWKSTLRRDYCNTPWKTAASIAAIFLLFLSLLQTLCSIVQVIQEK